MLYFQHKRYTKNTHNKTHWNINANETFGEIGKGKGIINSHESERRKGDMTTESMLNLELDLGALNTGHIITLVFITGKIYVAPLRSLQKIG